jgi:hypothetical protein
VGFTGIFEERFRMAEDYRFRPSRRNFHITPQRVL